MSKIILRSSGGQTEPAALTNETGHVRGRKEKTVKTRHGRQNGASARRY